MSMAIRQVFNQPRAWTSEISKQFKFTISYYYYYLHPSITYYYYYNLKLQDRSGNPRKNTLTQFYTYSNETLMQDTLPELA
jgi:hypothetical protein